MTSSSVHPPNEDPIDRAVVTRLRIEASQGAKDFFPQYVAYFCEDLEQAANDLVAAADENDAYQLMTIAHRLRGAAGNFGAHPLIASCLLLEELAKAGRVADALVVLPNLQGELRRVEEAIHGLSLS